MPLPFSPLFLVRSLPDMPDQSRIPEGPVWNGPDTHNICDYEITLASNVVFTSFSESLLISNPCFGP